MSKCFAVRYEAKRASIVEREVGSLGVRQLNEWFAVSRDAYEFWTASMEEAIKVAHSCCYAVRQEFAELSVEDLVGYQAYYTRRLDEHVIVIERRPWFERLQCVEEELHARLEAVEGAVALSGGWQLTLAKRHLDAREMAAIGYEPEDFLRFKQLYTVQPMA